MTRSGSGVGGTNREDECVGLKGSRKKAAVTVCGGDECAGKWAEPGVPGKKSKSTRCVQVGC